jgi:hypothetical protein
LAVDKLDALGDQRGETRPDTPHGDPTAPRPRQPYR